jgi:hypothetical protein
MAYTKAQMIEILTSGDFSEQRDVLEGVRDYSGDHGRFLMNEAAVEALSMLAGPEPTPAALGAYAVAVETVIEELSTANLI